MSPKKSSKNWDGKRFVGSKETPLSSAQLKLDRKSTFAAHNIKALLELQTASNDVQIWIARLGDQQIAMEKLCRLKMLIQSRNADYLTNIGHVLQREAPKPLKIQFPHLLVRAVSKHFCSIRTAANAMKIAVEDVDKQSIDFQKLLRYNTILVRAK